MRYYFTYANILHVNPFGEKYIKSNLSFHYYSCIIHLCSIIPSELAVEVCLMASIITICGLRGMQLYNTEESEKSTVCFKQRQKKDVTAAGEPGDIHIYRILSIAERIA